MKTLQILLVIAWRNLWRSKVRSLVVIAAMAMGIWAAIFLSGFSIGMNEQRTNSALSTYLGYAQIHGEGWSDEPTVGLLIPNIEEVVQAGEEAPGYVAHSARLVQMGSANSSRGSVGVRIQGIDPAEDTLVYDIHTRLVEGEYLPEFRRVPKVFVGEAMAEELHLEVGSSFTLRYQSVDGGFMEDRCKVGGTFRTVSSAFDKMNVFIPKEYLADKMGISTSEAHEIVYRTTSKEAAVTWAEGLNGRLEGVEVESWKEVSPELGYADDMMATSLYIFVGIIVFAITFGILNTMLMAILERKRELGMLMAVGMNKSRTFFMVVLETIFLGCVGAPLGIAIGHITLLVSSKSGFDLSAVGEGLNAYGMDAVVYPATVPDYYIGISVMVVSMTLLASLYPAYKALKLNPVEAIRSA
ncbi:MAG: ABC transporter permease [Flavobacteriia bacterium]|nr:ABC transporter permease [Flavobacteriia bacterium]